MLGLQNCAIFSSLSSISTSSDSSASISKSVTSVSDSISSISESSFGGGDEAARELYIHDFQSAGVQYAKERPNYESLDAVLSRVASRYHVQDWKKEPLSYVALGRGLKLAGVNHKDLELMIHELCDPYRGSEKELRSGYNQIWSL